MKPIQQILRHGVIELKGQFMPGSNYTFLVHVTHEGATTQAVYKPSKGEQPLWDFPENTLALREVAAYIVSEALGWHLVPFTTYREDGPFEAGSLQQYIAYDPQYHYFNFKPEDKARLANVVLFDLLINNADRKGSHVIVENETDHIYLIDHGLSFHAEEKLRTVIWDFAGGEIEPALRDDLIRLRDHLRSNLRAELEPYLAPAEIDALDARAQHLIASRMYPLPPQDRRAFPYPPL
jgi:uncharacterized repeat protein (TIGR03843 family)